MNELILPPEPRQSKNESRARPTIEIVVEPRERETKQSRRGPVSALLGAAAIIGAGVYVFQLAQSAMPKQAPAPVAAKATDAGLSEAQRQIAGLRSEIRDLRAKLEAVEKRQPAEAIRAEAAKAEAPAPEPEKAAGAAAPTPDEPASAIAPVKSPAPPAQPSRARAASAPQAAEAPRSMTPEPPAQVQKVAPTPPKILAGYRLRDAFRGNALVETRRGVIDVQPGDLLPGAGRVLAIQKRGGNWVVATESGDIVGDTRAQTRPPALRRRSVYREEYGYETGPLAPRMFMPF